MKTIASFHPGSDALSRPRRFWTWFNPRQLIHLSDRRQLKFSALSVQTLELSVVKGTSVHQHAKPAWVAANRVVRPKEWKTRKQD
ncbi:MAG: hypothetical protein ACK4RK_00255 [Gemmataceae bacterium]